MTITTPSRRLLRNHDTLVVWLQRVVNVIFVVASLLALSWWRNGNIADQYRFMAIIGALLMLGVYDLTGVYRRYAEDRLAGVQQLARSWGIVVIMLGMVAFVTKSSEDFSRSVILIWVIAAFAFQAWFYIFIHVIYERRQHSRLDRVPTLVVGTGLLATHLVNSIRRNAWLPERICGVLSETSLHQPSWDMKQVPVLGDTNQLIQVLEDHGIRRVYVALPLHLTHLVASIEQQLFDRNVDVIWAPDIFSLNLLNHSVRELAGVPLISLAEAPLISGGGRAFVKRLMDRVLGALALLIFSPLMAVTAIAIKCTSTGPVFFKQPRHGWDGRVFEVYKFRSMYVHGEEAGKVTQATKDDPRITSVGRLIRRLSIDELPQLFNVLDGTMSLVGPRPHAIAHNEFYTDKIDAYLSRHRIKPGMTGWAQIHGFRGETDTVEKMQRRVQYDLEYINTWSPWMDLKILLRTPFSLFSDNAL